MMNGARKSRGCTLGSTPNKVRSAHGLVFLHTYINTCARQCCTTYQLFYIEIFLMLVEKTNPLKQSEN